MNSKLASLVADFSQLKVLVVGDLILDMYTQGTMGRICPEAPAPIVDVLEDHFNLGGAGNTALNAMHLGAQVDLVSVIGADAAGSRAISLLHKEGLSSSSIRQTAGRTTLVKQRISVDRHTVLRLDRGSKESLDRDSIEFLRQRLADRVADADVIIISDYSYGVLSPAIISLFDRRQPHALLCVDSKRLPHFKCVRPDVVKPNRRQTLELLGHEPQSGVAPDVELAIREQSRLLEFTGAKTVVATMDRDGCVCLEDGHDPIRVPAPACSAPCVSGAGDTFLTTFGLVRALGADTATAAEAAVLTAGVVIRKGETATCTADELTSEVLNRRMPQTDLCGLVRKLESERRQGRRLVLTNGCFDILHRGHVTYLHRARALGDRLIVGVNSDESIRRLKGPTRPINSLPDRLGVLEALQCVDYLIAFDEDTPHRLIEAIRPHVFVKGGDYTRDRLPEANLVEELGGEVHILPLVADRSTTRIIDRIQRESTFRPDSTAGAFQSSGRTDHVSGNVGTSP